MTNATQLISITTEARPNSQLAATIEVGAERIQQVYNQVLNDLLRHTQLPGFRKGKVPKQLLLKKIGTEQFHYAVVEKLIEETVKEAVAQENIAYLGNLKLEPEAEFRKAMQAFDPQKPFRFSVTFDVKPEITPRNYQGLTIEYTPVTYDPASVEEVLQRHQREHATLIPVEDRPAAWGDEVTLKLVTKNPDSDEVIKTLSAEELPLTLDEKQPFLLPELPTAVVGMAIGESKTVSITLPQDSEDKAETSAKAVAEIEILEIKTPELPPLDDAFAAEHSEFSTMAELRQHLEKIHQERAQKQDKQAKEKALMDVLVAENEVAVPATYINQQAETIVKESLQRLHEQGLNISKVITPEIYEKMVDEAKPRAQRLVQADLLLRAIAQAEGIVPSEEAINGELENYLKELDRVNAKEREAIRNFAKLNLTNSLTIDWLLARNTFQAITPPAQEPAVAPEIGEAAPAKTQKRAAQKAAPPPAAE